MNDYRLKDRAAGSIVGALIGDALALGPHWYYDLEQLREHFGPWIDGYTDPKPGRYHEGLKAGNLSQSGLITLDSTNPDRPLYCRPQCLLLCNCQCLDPGRAVRRATVWQTLRNG